MALSGTIKDFGISDIFQLIAQQRKTGILVLNDGTDEVRIHFRAGEVVRVESKARPKNMLLGSMLVRAGLVEPEQIDTALEHQKLNLKRLGGVLEELGATDADTVREFVRLQTMDTVLRLFLWREGNYAFEVVDVPPPPAGVDPIGAEHILMEGVRMIDEWPRIKAQVPSYTAAYEQAKPVPIAMDFGAGVDIGPSERRVWELAFEPATVEDLIARSRLGEFETCRAVVALVTGGYLRAAKPVSRASRAAPPKKKGPSVLKKLRPDLILVRVALYALLTLGGLMLARAFDPGLYGVERTDRVSPRTTETAERFAAAQMSNIRRALEVYRLEHGQYPRTLDGLVQEGIMREHDLRYPFVRRYHYAVDESGAVVLERPLR